MKENKDRVTEVLTTRVTEVEKDLLLTAAGSSKLSTYIRKVIVIHLEELERNAS